MTALIARLDVAAPHGRRQHLRGPARNLARPGAPRPAVLAPGPLLLAPPAATRWEHAVPTGLTLLLHASVGAILLWGVPVGIPAAPRDPEPVEVVFARGDAVPAAPGGIGSLPAMASTSDAPPLPSLPAALAPPLAPSAAAPLPAPPPSGAAAPVIAPVLRTLPEPLPTSLTARVPPGAVGPLAAPPAAPPAQVPTAAQHARTDARPVPRPPSRPAPARGPATPAARPSGLAAGPATQADGVRAASAVAPGPQLITAPRFRRPPRPAEYPARAVELELSGIVLVRALLDPDGDPTEIRVQHSSGHPMLDSAALVAVRRWAFEPAVRDGQRVAAWVEVPVQFQLR